jgi:hypothetical protein
VVTSSQAISGTGVNFNGLTTFDQLSPPNGASTTTEAFGPQLGDNDVVKISDIGLITSVTTTQSADLQFGVTNVDADGDKTLPQTLDVQITGTTMNGTPLADVLQSSAGNDTMTGNGGNDLFVLDGHSSSPNVGAGGHDTIADFLSGSDEILVDVASQNLTIGTSTVVPSANFHTGDETVAATWNNGTGNEFVYNTSSHELWFSANGTGTDKIDLAHISTGTPVAADIHTF